MLGDGAWSKRRIGSHGPRLKVQHLEALEPRHRLGPKRPSPQPFPLRGQQPAALGRFLLRLPPAANARNVNPSSIAAGRGSGSLLASPAPQPWALAAPARSGRPNGSRTGRLDAWAVPARRGRIEGRFRKPAHRCGGRRASPRATSDLEAADAGRLRTHGLNTVPRSPMEVTPHVETSLIETIPECRTSIRFEPLRSSTTHPIKHRQMTLPAALSLCRSANSTLSTPRLHQPVDLGKMPPARSPPSTETTGLYSTFLRPGVVSNATTAPTRRKGRSQDANKPSSQSTHGRHHSGGRSDATFAHLASTGPAKARSKSTGTTRMSSAPCTLPSGTRGWPATPTSSRGVPPTYCATSRPGPRSSPPQFSPH